jgi:hypothetical protein
MYHRGMLDFYLDGWRQYGEIVRPVEVWSVSEHLRAKCSDTDRPIYALPVENRR